MICWYMLDYVPSSPWSGLWVRQDLLEKAGLEPPKTIEDWDNMLHVFKDQFGTLLGCNIPQWYGVATNYQFAASYDSAYEWIAKDGKTAAYGPIEPGYKDFLALLHKWYEEGILDPDFATITDADYQAKMADGTYGAFGSAYGEIGQAKVTGMNNNPEYKLLAVSMPTSYEGQQTHLRQTDFIVRTDYDVLTTRAVDEGIEETVIRWKDFWYSQFGGDLCSYGPENVSYKWVDAGDGREVVTFFDKHVDEAKLKAALKLSAAEEFVNKLDKGVKTDLKEHGSGLSLGQMQRLAIARAIYQDAPILLLDEATSSLDEKIEQTVLDNLSKLKNKTIIFVTHHKAVLAITDKEVAFPGKNE